MPTTDFPPIDLTGIAGYGALKLTQIDAACRTMAALTLADGPTVSELCGAADGYALSSTSPWLVAFNRDKAALIDVDARLDAASSLRCHPDNAGIVYFLDLYADLVREAAGVPTVMAPRDLHPTEPSISELADQVVVTPGIRRAA